MAAPRSNGSMSTPSRPAGSALDASAEPDWTDQVTDLIVDLVDSTREKTTGPILTAARGVVYGVVILVIAAVLIVAGLAFGGRALALIPVPEWASYGILGLLFAVIGVVCWGRRNP